MSSENSRRGEFPRRQSDFSKNSKLLGLLVDVEP